ncbi:lactonase family protein [Sediminibacterium sp. TEGAF015]|uniref:lactonase family protein n=1 Tax=Sediminibacterium sp. TEGAF015 TaxID=575378 RepID=UPI002232903C|nr:lactonase family protein [Sediminibacterium sp. TEGAF015]
MKPLKTGLLFLIIVFTQGLSSNAQKPNGQKLLIGSYTNGVVADGIYYYQFNSNGSTDFISKTAAADPSFLAPSLTKPYLYAVNELGNGNGAVSAYRFDKVSGSFQLLNTVLSGGDHPCHISIDAQNRFAFVSNYSGGNFSVMRIETDGKLSNAIQTIQHTGSSVNKSRQDKPHVHSAFISPDEKYVLVQDLGTDLISVYSLNLSNTRPVSEKPISIFQCNPGDGPRHISFHPTKPIVYAVQELTGSVTVLNFTKGILKKMQEVNMFAQGVAKKSGAADIHVSPDGKFLYASNRADFNDLAIFKIAKNGWLQWVGSEPTLGLAPRNFAIDPTGQFLLAANQNSNEVVVFKRNLQTGKLIDTGKRIAVSKPVCLKFID